MRIIGGNWRGLKLAEVGEGDPKAHLRPTSDRVREAVFNLLVNGRQGDLVRGARVLDLFSGTGALGLEALSRGALQAVLVDDGKVSARLIAANMAKMASGGALVARHLRADATALPRASETFDLVFLDPPYGKGLGERALASAQAQGWLAPGARVMWEEGAQLPPPEGFTLLDQRRYGETWVTLLSQGVD
ncbi:16S rRNA (guanine(966)-N(2))-methyltransferase RsmD [Stagnihabitans tardus]|uniref:16S rRNA (Guanine(966)-N(2))-methyltransferase RsmD n=1 Tax=Stagnihabitans tardus TaxID=2699202 RepID=A0AAE4YB20_9RHOB|nr:16S rRNA (guanine(966)-N(2))-methyltransferase RsmD [Stagnihabitans tardus]NBZ88397.1 16S rRNA (guanine(966)-N(2))-methyltransferase RsmD [Stagnihabitans tardus]